MLGQLCRERHTAPQNVPQHLGHSQPDSMGSGKLQPAAVATSEEPMDKMLTASRVRSRLASRIHCAGLPGETSPRSSRVVGTVKLLKLWLSASRFATSQWPSGDSPSEERACSNIGAAFARPTGRVARAARCASEGAPCWRPITFELSEPRGW